MSFFRRPSLKKMILGVVAQRVLRRTLPKAIPGGVVALLAAEGVKLYLDHRKKKLHEIPQAHPSAKKNASKSSSSKKSAASRSKSGR